MTEFSLLTDTGNGRTGRYRDGGENIRRYGKEAEQGNETVIDAYCGTGTISLYLAQKAKHVIGIEIIPAAIENAQKMQKKSRKKRGISRRRCCRLSITSSQKRKIGRHNSLRSHPRRLQRKSH